MYRVLVSSLETYLTRLNSDFIDLSLLRLKNILSHCDYAPFNFIFEFDSTAANF